MNKIILLLIFSISFIKVWSQTDADKKSKKFKVHQISFNGALSSTGLLFKREGKLNWASDSFSYKGSSKPAMQIGYEYYFNKRISLGILASSQSMNMNIDYLIFKNPSEITKRYNDIDIKVKRKYIGVRFNYHLIQNAKSDFYTTLRFGSVSWKITPSLTDSDLDEKLETSLPGTMLPAIAMGYKYKIKETVGLGFELSIGTPHVFAYGLDIRF